MGYPLGLPGLDAFINDVPDGGIIVVEGGLDPTKGFFARHVAHRAADSGRLVAFVTSHDGDSALRALQEQAAVPSGLQVVPLTDWGELSLPDMVEQDLVVDAFSPFLMDLTPVQLVPEMRRLRSHLQVTGRSAILVLEKGLLSSAHEGVIHHFADGLIQFHTREGSDGIQQFLRIPKWVGGRVFLQNIHYSFDGRRLLVDTRRRLS